jgi:hypothetical protein
VGSHTSPRTSEEKRASHRIFSDQMFLAYLAPKKTRKHVL